MSLVLTPLGSDNFTPDANPINASLWTGFPSYVGRMNASGGYAVGDTLGDYNGAFWKAALPNDCYISGTFYLTNPASFSGFDLYVRSATDFSGQYVWFDFYDNGDGTGYADVSQGGVSVASNAAQPFSSGDRFTLAAVGNVVYVLQNGIQILTGNLTPSSGQAGFDVFPYVDVTYAKAALLEVGSASLGVVLPFIGSIREVAGPDVVGETEPFLGTVTVVGSAPAGATNPYLGHVKKVTVVPAGAANPSLGQVVIVGSAPAGEVDPFLGDVIEN